MGSRGKKRGNVRDEVIDFAGESKLLCGEANEEFFNFIRGRRVRHWRATRAPMIRDAGGNSGFEDQGLQKGKERK